MESAQRLSIWQRARLYIRRAQANPAQPHGNAPIPPQMQAHQPIPALGQFHLPPITSSTPMQWSINTPTLRSMRSNTPPSRPTDHGPQLAFPRRSAFFRFIPHATTIALLGYVAIRIFTFATIPWISWPIAIALFLAEMHCVVNGLAYQKDIKNEEKYDQWKKANWPTFERIRETLSPRGPRVAMQIASAPEEPSTCWPTIYGTVEMEGNKKVIWNTQADGGWIKIDAPKDKKSPTAFIDVFKKFQKRGPGGEPSPCDLLEAKYSQPQYAWIWQNVRQCDTLPLPELTKTHQAIGEIPYQEKLRLVQSVNEEYSAVWGFVRQQVENATTARFPVDTSGWNVPDQEETAQRTTALGRWRSLSEDQKKAVLRNIYRMLGRRHITRGGLWIWWGSERREVSDIDDPEFTKLMHKVFFGVLRTSGEVEEVGLGQEVDITPYGYQDNTGIHHSFGDELESLAKKVRAYVESEAACATPQERLLYAFDYMRDIIGMDKREQEAGGGLEYFPRNIRSGGEDIKTGLEYETLADECDLWDEADLDYQFERVVNTYVNHHVTWWDRDRFADMDHGGRKSNSINSLVHHLAGRWKKVVPQGRIPTDKSVSGFVIPADNFSALMRIFLERLENGQYLWDTLLSANPNFRAEVNQQTTADALVNYLERALSQVNLKGKRWVFVNNLLNKLTAAGPFTEANFRQVLLQEGLLPASPSPALDQHIRRTVAWLIRETTVEGQRRILHYFFDQASRYLDLSPHGTFLRTMVADVIRDQQMPANHVVYENYCFDEIEYFTNIDAEVRPRPDFMARTIPLLDKLIEHEVPPRPTLLDRILHGVFGRRMGGSLKAGFLQCPQFYTIDPETGEPLHFTAHVDQRLFYQSIQPSKSLNDGAFSCGSNVVYHLPSKRETSERLFTEPTAVQQREKRKQLSNPIPNVQGKAGLEPGGWSYKYTASEIYVPDKDGVPRPVIAYQTAESPTEDHASTIHFIDYEEGKKAFHKKGVFLNDVIGKGESPKDLNNLSGKQHPKWAGGTIGDFFYIIMPRYMRAIPGASFIAQQILRIANLMPASVRAVGKAAVKAADAVLFRLPLVRHLWRFVKILARYGDHLTWETSMSHKPKMSPFSKVGMEFFRSGTWYERGLRDLVLIGAPALLTSSILGSALLGQIFTGLCTPILINPYVFGAFFLVYLATSLSAYLYSTKRLGQRVSDVMLKKEAVLLGQGWPGYLHADFWGLLGPSGRLGATTTKGVGGREALVSKYALPSMLAGFASLAGAVTGVWLLGNTIFYLGAAAAFGGPGIGIALCTFWALYHAGMIFRGFGISQSLNTNFAQEHFDRLKSEVEIRDSDGRGTRFLRRRLKTLEDILLTFRGIGFSINKTLIEDQLNALYAPKSLHKKLDDRIIPSAIRENIRGWRRLNPLIFSGKVLYGLLGMFRRPEKW